MIDNFQPKDSLNASTPPPSVDLPVSSPMQLDSVAEQSGFFFFPGLYRLDHTQLTLRKLPVLTWQSSLEELVKEDYPIPGPLAQPAAEAPRLITEVIGLPSRVLPEQRIQRHQADWVVGLLILVFALFATVRLFFGKYLQQLFYAAINYSTASRLFRERSVSLTHASFRLDIIFYLIGSLFLFQIFDDSINIPVGHGLLKYLLLLGCAILYFSLKQFLYVAQGKLSETNTETQELLYNMNLYNRILGLGLIPIVLVLAFSRLTNPQIMIRVGLGMVLICYVLLIFRGLKILMRKDFPIFYLILYLCTLEILPLFFIYKLVLV